MSLHKLLEAEGVYQDALLTGMGQQCSLTVDVDQKNAPMADSIDRCAPPLVDDVHLIVHHMSSLPPETRSLFVSDMGFVVDYLNDGSFEKRRNQKIVHVQALCDMMETLTGDKRFTELAEELLQRQQERNGVIMCEYIDMLEAKGMLKGENRLARLIQILLKEHRYAELAQVADNSEKRHEMYQAYGL